MNKDDVIKIIDGIPFYRYEYTDFLYQKLEDYKYRCEKAIEYIKKEKENYLTKGSSIADTNNANLIVSAAVNTCDCSLNILQNGSEKDDR